MDRAFRSLLIPCVALLALSSCSRQPTAIRVLVTTNFDPALSASAFHLERIIVRGYENAEPATTPRLDRSFVLAPVPGGVSLPLEFNILPRGGDAVVRIEAEGYHTAQSQPNERSFVSARVITSFRNNQTLLVPLVLYHGCAGRMCGAEQTCDERGECVPARREPETFAPFLPDASIDIPRNNPDQSVDLDATMDSPTGEVSSDTFISTDQPSDLSSDRTTDNDAGPEVIDASPEISMTETSVTDASDGAMEAAATPVDCPGLVFPIASGRPSSLADGGTAGQARRWPAMAADPDNFFIAWIEGTEANPGGSRVSGAFFLRDDFEVVGDPRGVLSSVFEELPTGTHFQELEVHTINGGFLVVAQYENTNGASPVLVARQVSINPGFGAIGRTITLSPSCILPALVARRPTRTAVSDGSSPRILACAATNVLNPGQCQLYDWSIATCPAAPVPLSLLTVTNGTPVGAAFSRDASSRGFQVLFRRGPDFCTYRGMGTDPLSTVADCALRDTNVEESVSTALWLDRAPPRFPTEPAGWRAVSARRMMPQSFSVLPVPSAGRTAVERTIPPGLEASTRPLSISYGTQTNTYRGAWCRPTSGSNFGNYTFSFPSMAPHTVLVPAGNCLHSAQLSQAIPWPPEAPVGDVFPLVTVESAPNYGVQLYFFREGLTCR